MSESTIRKHRPEAKIGPAQIDTLQPEWLELLAGRFRTQIARQTFLWYRGLRNLRMLLDDRNPLEKFFT